jgi:hypothetical protein
MFPAPTNTIFMGLDLSGSGGTLANDAMHFQAARIQSEKIGSGGKGHHAQCQGSSAQGIGA